MTTIGHDALDRQALDWVIRVDDPAFEDWDAFTGWLAEDERNAERYDRMGASLASATAIAASIPPTPLPTAANDEPAPRRSYRRWAGGAVAAALLGIVGTNLWNDRPQPYDVATAAGQQRTVALADGSEIVVAGGSRVRLDHASPRMASVEAGAVLFRVRHDASAPFVVHAGGIEVVDLGTVFDVSQDAGVTRVAVGEGAVVIDPKAAALRLDPGQAVSAANGRLERQAVVPADVGSWREGVLRFDDAALPEVAAVLTRTLGHVVQVMPSITSVRFSGTVDAARIRHDPALLGQLLDVSVSTTDNGWRLEPSH